MARAYGLTIDALIGITRSNLGDPAPRRFSDGQIVRALNNALMEYLRVSQRLEGTFDIYTHPSDATWQAPVGTKGTLTAPGPGVPAFGARYLINGVGAGGWTGKDYQIAECTASATPTWAYTTPTLHMAVYVTDEALPYIYDTTAKWQLLTAETSAARPDYELPWSSFQVIEVIWDPSTLAQALVSISRAEMHRTPAYVKATGIPLYWADTPTGLELYPTPSGNGSRFRVRATLSSVYVNDTQLAGPTVPTDYSLRLFNRTSTPHTSCPPAHHYLLPFGAAAALLESEDGSEKRAIYLRQRFITELHSVRKERRRGVPQVVRPSYRPLRY